MQGGVEILLVTSCYKTRIYIFFMKTVITFTLPTLHTKLTLPTVLTLLTYSKQNCDMLWRSGLQGLYPDLTITLLYNFKNLYPLATEISNYINLFSLLFVLSR